MKAKGSMFREREMQENVVTVLCTVHLFEFSFIYVFFCQCVLFLQGAHNRVPISVKKQGQSVMTRGCIPLPLSRC